MNIISHFYNILEESFNNYLKQFFHEHNYYNKSSNFNNYFSFMKSLDDFSTSFHKDVIVSYFQYIDDVFFNSSYRKKFCTSKGFYERKNYVTIFGEITFKRRYYYDKTTKERFFFVDLFFNLPKRKHFDPLVCAELIDLSSTNSYSKAGKLVADKIGSRLNNTINISRASTRNIVMSFDIDNIVPEEKERKQIERLFIMLDEKFVGSQFNNGKDYMIKAAVVFENTELEYKTKKKENSTDRYKLVNPHVCSSISDSLTNDVVDYIYNNYDPDYLKEICFMGDCAKWIKNFPKSTWFKFNKDIINSFSMDGFHFSQALMNLTTTKNEIWYNALNQAVKKNNISLFRRLCERFIDENKEREITIRTKMEYILNNWEERQLYQNKNYLKCSMESHISHIFADLFTSRPKAYSKKGLTHLLKLRMLKVNNENIKEIYYNSINKLFSPSNTKTILNYRKELNLEYEEKNKYDIEYELPNDLKMKLYNN